MLQRSSIMNFHRLQLLYFMEISRKYILKHPVQLLKLCRHLGSHNRGSLLNESQQQLNLAQRNHVQSFRLKKCEKESHCNIYNISGETVSDIVKSGVPNLCKGDFAIFSHCNVVRHFAPQIATSPMHKVSANHITAPISASLYRNTDMHMLLQKSFSHQVNVRHMLPQTSLLCSPYLHSTQRLYSTYNLNDKYFLQTKRLGIGHSMFPVSVMNVSLNNILTSKGIVRFYRGQGHTIFKHSKEFNNESLNGTVDANSDVGSESCMLSHSISQTDLADDRNHDVTQITVDGNCEKDKKDIAKTRKSVDDMTLPELSRASFNIVPYVSRSVTLQNLVRLGVSLDKVQKVAGVAEHLIKSDFDRDIVPLLKFLVHVGIEADNFGHILTSNPLLFMEAVPNLEHLVGYFLDKSFTLKEIATIFTSAPVVLLMNPVMLDEKLGFLQNVFGLTDHQVREVVKIYPKLLPRKKELLADVKFHVHEFIGFTNSEITQLILKDPIIFVSGKSRLIRKFDYLHNHMQISHQQILIWPNVMRVRQYIVKNRHLFLMSRDRAQYDPCKENYVSMQALVSGTDEEFCQNVAKCLVQDFYNFCKTL